MRNVIFIFALIVLYHRGATAQQDETRFYIEVDTSAVVIGESLKVSFILENGKNNSRFTPPDWEAAGFMVLRNSQSSNVSIYNGKTTASLAYQFIITPVEEGKLTIPAVRIKNGDQELHTESIPIQAIRNADGTRPNAPKKTPVQPKNEPKKRSKTVRM